LADWSILPNRQRIFHPGVAVIGGAVPKLASWVTPPIRGKDLRAGRLGRTTIMLRTFKLAVSCCAIVAQFFFLAIPPAHGQQLSSNAMSQIGSLLSEKRSRTPVEQKVDSNLLFAARAIAQRTTQSATAVPTFVRTFIAENVEAGDLIPVTIRANVTEDLLSTLAGAGALDVAAFPRFDTVTAKLPVSELLVVAAHADVRFIRPRERPMTNSYAVTSEGGVGIPKPSSDLVLDVGSVTSQGVVAHAVDKALSTGISGAGTFVCVLSNGVDSAGARQATGDIPTPLYYLTGQLGSGDEGTAMLEIVHDMAPGAALGFATGGPSEAQMATNILNLRSVLGCEIIVDDINFPTESAFQDGVIAQAVNSVVASGAMYFSSAVNSGNVTHGFSGTWEGDWADSGVTFPDSGFAVPAHRFGTNPYDVLGPGALGNTSQAITLQWSDPWGASNNDYDLFLVNSSGTTIIAQSTNTQSGTQDPFELFYCTPASCPVGSLIVVTKYSGATRALRVDTRRGTLSVGTTQSTFGHNAAATALTVAAVDVAHASGGSFTGGAADPVESFSSDGPRTMFYNSDGSAITPGNVLFATGGGSTLAKVDLAAADGVATAEPAGGGLNPFYGTSAAAPHAAAIAALVSSANPSATATTIKNALFASALDIEAAGWDRDSGVGIVMAPAAIRAVLTPITVSKSFTPSTIPPGGTSTLTLTLTNTNATALDNVAFTDTYPAQIRNASPPNAGGNGTGCSGSLLAGSNGGSLQLSAGVVPAGATCNIFVTVTSNTLGMFQDSTGAVTTPISLNSPAASASLTVGLAPTITSANSSAFTIGTAGTFTITTTGAPTATIGEVGALPSGVTFVDNGNGTATLSGITTFGGSYPLTITASNGVLPNATQAFTLNVNATKPGAPTGAVATAGNSQATITFTAPLSDGGNSITSYTATSSPGGKTGSCVAPCNSIIVGGLNNGTAYTFTVVATNGIGSSLPSATSNSVTPATVPDAPTIGVATAGSAQATVTFSAPVSNGGSAITSYSATSLPDGKVGTCSAPCGSVVVTGLQNGTPYTFTVTASNKVGNSLPSTPSNVVTPMVGLSPVLQSVKSRKVHGGAGAFDLPLAP
jgi:Subtilase family/Fibronectin type III domain